MGWSVDGTATSMWPDSCLLAESRRAAVCVATYTGKKKAK